MSLRQRIDGRLLQTHKLVINCPLSAHMSFTPVPAPSVPILCLSCGEVIFKKLKGPVTDYL